MICTIERVPIGSSFQYLHSFRIFSFYLYVVLEKSFIVIFFIVVDINFQPFCVGNFTTGTMKKLRAIMLAVKKVKIEVEAKFV